MRAGICLLVSILCTAVTYSQIKPGLYGKKISSWYVYVKNDTAYTEYIGVKTSYAWVGENSMDTLIKRNNSSFSGSRYSFVFEKGKYYLVETNPNKKRNRRMRLVSANERMLQYWEEAHNLLVLMQLRKQYPKLEKILFGRNQYENSDEILEGYLDLEGLLGMKQEPFLEEVRKFEDKFLR